MAVELFVKTERWDWFVTGWISAFTLMNVGEGDWVSAGFDAAMVLLMLFVAGLRFSWKRS